MKPGLSLRMSQHLALTPQLQQSIRLLQLSTLELGQEVEQMLTDNPFLEREPDEVPEAPAVEPSAPADPYEVAEPVAFDRAQDLGSTTTSSNTDEEQRDWTGEEAPDWGGDESLEPVADDGDWGGARQGDADDEHEASDLAHAHESLQEHLKVQALALRLEQGERLALEFLIESLDEDGYLKDPLDELVLALLGAEADADSVQELQHHFTVALKLLQHLDPAGVGARDLAECLLIQLDAQERVSAPGAQAAQRATLDLARRICHQPLELLARRDVRGLSQRCNATEGATREALALIARLEPKPGRPFVDVQRNIVVPDVLVLPVGGGEGATARFRVVLNPEVMPRLRVHDVYARVLRNHRGGADAASHASLQQHLQEARWFIKNIQQRFDTILRVSTAIAERQRSFFTHGALAMRPLVMREIADELGLHESTISRVTTAKYMATPQGTFELKYFFGSGLGTDAGGNASSTAVRALIRQFIGAEDPRKPLSDSQLSDMLAEQGIECARRTVAKYREGLRIPTATLRRAL